MKNLQKLIEKKCEKCIYFGRPSDAPETVNEDCMYTPTEDEDYALPCEK